MNLLQIAQFNHQVEVKRGVMEQECSRMLKTFFKDLRERIKRGEDGEDD